MEDDEEQNLRKKKLSDQQKMVEAKKAEEQLKSALRVAVSEDAYQRMMNVKLANQNLFLVVSQNLLRIFQKVQRKITDHEVLMMLKTIKQQSEKESKITFERK